MKIAYLTSRFPYAAIGETFLVPEARQLVKFCDEVHVIPARPRSRRTLFAGLGTVNVRIAPFSPGTLKDALLEAGRDPAGAARAARALFGPSYALRAKVRNALLFPKALAVARYVRLHEIGHIHAHWLTTPATLAYAASILTGVPWSCTAHAHDIVSGNLLREKAASAQFIRFIAERNRAHFLSLVSPCRPVTYTIHLGVDVPPSVNYDESAGRTLRIACAARLDPIKGHEYLMRALAAMSRDVPLSCDIVGDGQMRHKLRALLKELDLGSRVHMRGMIEYGRFLRELRDGKYDVVVLPSLEFGEERHEGIPVVLIEAMAAGVPCIATSTGCIPELIDASSGLLVCQRDAGALRDAIILMARSGEMREAMGIAARRRVAALFNAESTGREIYELILACTDAFRAGHTVTPRVSAPASMPHANAN